MPGFLYFLPDHPTAPTPVEIAGLGLKYALDGPLASRQVIGGPDGGNGIVVAAEDRVPDQLVGYFPGKGSAAPGQAWRKLPGLDVWVGAYLDARRPTPADLRRSTAIAGYPVTLLDGQVWEIPVPRAFTGEQEMFRTAVPRRLDLDDAGGLVYSAVVSEYQQLFNLAAAWFQAKSAAAVAAEVDGESVRFRYVEDVVRAAVEVLGANYAVGYVEAIALLGLLTEELAIRILDLAADLPHIEDWLLKKTEVEASSVGPSALPGPEASAPATAPASPSFGPSNKA
jgi:hypothetical protein